DREIAGTLSDSSPALKGVSPVRHTGPPTPFVCAVTETSERNVVSAEIVTCREAAEDEVAFDAVSVTLYVPRAAKTCDGFCCVDTTPSPKFHDHDDGEPVD